MNYVEKNQIMAIMVWEIIRIKMENRGRKISLLEMGKVKATL